MKQPALAVALPASPEALERAEAKMLEGVQPVTFLKHHFAPGIYVREIWMPATAIILGHEHLTTHLNIVVSGKCIVRTDEGIRQITAGPMPVTFKSSAGVRKALFIVEDTTWMTVHENPDELRDVASLEILLTKKSPTYNAFEAGQMAQELKDMGLL